MHRYIHIFLQFKKSNNLNWTLHIVVNGMDDIGTGVGRGG